MIKATDCLGDFPQPAPVFLHLLHVLVRLRCVARDAQHSGVTLLLCLSLSRRLPKHLCTQCTHSRAPVWVWTRGQRPDPFLLLPPWQPADPQLPVPRGTFREDVVFFPSRERLRGCESWQNAQSSCLLRKGAVTSDQVSCGPLFLHCGEGGMCQPGPGAAPSCPVVPTKQPSFPLSPAWQSISCLPAGTGALS